MDYIQEIRRKIGHAPLVLPGAAVLILNPRGELLMVLRTDNGCWGIPGGSLEPGESLEQAAVRETFEETGLRLPQLELFGVFSGPELYYRYPNGDEVYLVSAIYVCRQAQGEIVLDPAEHSRWQYVPLDALPQPLSPPIGIILEKFKASLQTPYA